MTRSGFIARAPVENFVFRPIDDVARAAGSLLLKDARGRQHCGYWDLTQQRWCYAGGTPIGAEIVEYAARQAESAPPPQPTPVSHPEGVPC